MPYWIDRRGSPHTAVAANAADRLDWAAIRQAAKDRNGIPVAITR